MSAKASSKEKGADRIRTAGTEPHGGRRRAPPHAGFLEPPAERREIYLHPAAPSPSGRTRPLREGSRLRLRTTASACRRKFCRASSLPLSRLTRPSPGVSAASASGSPFQSAGRGPWRKNRSHQSRRRYGNDHESGASVHPDAALAIPRPGPQPNGKNTIGVRVLIVEDHADTRLSLERLLTKWGHTVASAETSGRRSRAARSEEFDLLLTDLGLPDGHGLDLMRRNSRPRRNDSRHCLERLRHGGDTELQSRGRVCRPFHETGWAQNLRAEIAKSRGLRGNESAQPKAASHTAADEFRDQPVNEVRGQRVNVRRHGIFRRRFR